MDVIFGRLDSRRYGIGIRRSGRYDVGPDVAVRPGPGDSRVPHDLVHFVVEEQARVMLGIFGQVAVGGDAGFFTPAVDRSQTERKRFLRLGRAVATTSVVPSNSPHSSAPTGVSGRTSSLLLPGSRLRSRHARSCPCFVGRGGRR